MPYVELDRRFALLSADDVAGDPDWSAPAPGVDQGWEALLQEPVTVILGPGGTGKTTEMREQARRLRADGRVAVFVALEQLVDQTLEEALVGEEATAFRAWNPAGGEAVFLLDAVNEAKLAKPGALPRALKAFARAAGRGRVRVLLSCRPSDWRHQADADTVRDALRDLLQPAIMTSAPSGKLDGPMASPDSLVAIPAAPAVIPVTVATVRLLPLDETRIRRLATHYGVDRADAFIDALKKTGHLFLAGRPWDLEWLADYWKREGRIGARWDMLDLNVMAKLREANEAHSGSDPLSPETALWGAEHLAGATILCRQPAIRLPDSVGTLHSERPALDPATVLRSWSAREIAALLGRPLFEEAPSGRVRWHHASTQTYLAGRWLLRLLTEGCPVTTVVDLLSQEGDGRRYLVPSLREVAGWVCCRHAAVREALTPIAPELVLLWGDAVQVPIEPRAKALRTLVEDHPETVSFDWTVETDDLLRLADPALLPTIQSVLSAPGGSVAVRRFLLDLMRVGGWRDGAETAMAIAADAAQDLRVRTAAVDTVGAAGDAALRGRLRTYAIETPGLPNALLARVGSVLLPDTLSVEDAAVLLAKFSLVSPDTIGGEVYAIGWGWVNACRSTDREALLARLIDLITSAPHAPGQRRMRTMPISEHYGWLIHAVSRTVALEVARTAGTDAEPTPVLVRGLWLLSECMFWGDPMFHERDALLAALAENTAVRLALYASVLSSAEHPQMEFTRLEGQFCRSQPGDVGGLLAHADKAETSEDRRRLLLGACIVAHRHGLLEEMRSSLEAALATAGLSAAQVEELRRWIDPAPASPPSDPDTEADAAMAEAAAAETAALADARHRLTEEIDELRRGEAFAALHYLAGQMRRLPGATAARWGQSNIDALEATFGAEIRDAAFRGLIRWWRGWRPPLPSERDDPSSVEHGVVVGLTGLAIYAAAGGDLTKLSPEDTQIATHYALREINGPPDWFPTLLAAKPEVVGEVLKAEIGAMFGEAPTMSRDRQSLRAIAALEPAAKLVADDLLMRLEQRLPEETDGLVDALTIVAQGPEQVRPRLAALSARRAADLWDTDRDKALPWLQAWLGTDVGAAWGFVEQALAAAPREARDLLVQFLGFWDEDRFDVKAIWGELRQRPSLLARIIPTVFRLLPPHEDPRHSGVYEVAAVDQAVEIRGRLSRMLEQIDGSEAHAALKALAVHVDLAAVRPFFEAAVRRHGEAAAEAAAWTPARVVAFAAEHECDPTTPGDLFRLACTRLEAIRHDVEERDFGDRGIFPPGTDEEVLQRYFAGRLERESRGRYDVTREEEVADHKEPDIRIRRPQVGVVSIEIKPLDDGRYSVAQLKSTLKDQLVGQYMRAVDARHGILLLCMIKNRKWQITKPDGTVDRSAGLSDLLKVLNGVAAELVADRSDIDGLAVIGIDVTAWEKSGKAGRPEKAKSPAAVTAAAPAKPGRQAKAKIHAPADGT